MNINTQALHAGLESALRSAGFNPDAAIAIVIDESFFQNGKAAAPANDKPEWLVAEEDRARNTVHELSNRVVAFASGSITLNTVRTTLAAAVSKRDRVDQDGRSFIGSVERFIAGSSSLSQLKADAAAYRSKYGLA